MKLIILISLFLLGCSDNYYNLVHCSDSYNSRDCSIPAKFRDEYMCKNFLLIYSSRVDYSELQEKRKTTIHYYPTSELSIKYNSTVHCEKK